MSRDRAEDADGTDQSELRCVTNGHQRTESTFRTDDNERLTVATCRRCGSRLGSWFHE